MVLDCREALATGRGRHQHPLEAAFLLLPGVSLPGICRGVLQQVTAGERQGRRQREQPRKERSSRRDDAPPASHSIASAARASRLIAVAIKKLDARAGAGMTSASV